MDTTIKPALDPELGWLRNSKLQFYFVCVVLIATTVTGVVHSHRTETARAVAMASREALRLHELFRIRLTLQQAAINEVADLLHADRIPGEAEFERINQRALSQNPMLLALGWVRNRESTRPLRLAAQGNLVSDDLAALWDSPAWSALLARVDAAGRELVSSPITLAVAGEERVLVVYLVPVDSGYYDNDEGPTRGGYAFGVLQIQQVFEDSITATLEAEARVELLDGGERGRAGAPVAIALAGAADAGASWSERHQVSSSFEWGGRDLLLRMTPSSRFLAVNGSPIPWLVAAMGALILVLMFRLYNLLESMSANQRRELSQREREIERKELQTSALLDVAPVSILMLNAEGVIVGLSNRSISLDRETCLGRRFADVGEDGTFTTLDGQPVKLNDNPTLRALRGERVSNLQLRRRVDGQDFYYSLSASPIVDKSGEIIGSVCVSSDVTDLVSAIEGQKKINLQLESSNQRLQQFASVASHDLQEPLRKITSFASLLELELGDELSDEPKQYLDFMVDGAKRMSNLIRDILQYSEITPGNEELTSVDLEQAFATAQAGLADRIEASGATLTLHNSLPVWTSERMFPLLLGNLISNSIKYRSEWPPAIAIEALEQGDGVMVMLCDNGMGIAEEYREQVFNMFKRLHGRGKISGTGIGLAICKQIVELNGGRIWIEDNSSGQGCCFKMYFPH